MMYAATFCQCLCLLVVGVAAGSKVRTRASFHEFVESLAALGFLRMSHSRPFAVLTVLAEAVVVILLFPGVLDRRLGFAAAALLFTGLTVGVAVAVAQGRRVPCRCFGGRAIYPLGRRHVARNILLLAVAICGLISADANGGRPVGHVMAAAMGLLTALAVLIADDVVDLFKPVPSAPSQKR